MKRTLRRSGFTLVELLVVIAIIGILVGLLLPAVQAAREAARRMQCSNNLKQLGLALHNYESAYKQFPFGTMVNNPANPLPNYPWRSGDHRKGTVLVKILPFMEQGNLYNSLDFKFDVYRKLSQLGFDRDTKMSIYICPSDGTTVKKLGRARQFYNYAPCIGNQNLPAHWGGCNLYPNNSWQTRSAGIYGGNLFKNGWRGHGSSNDGRGISGVFSRYSYGAKLSEITDGTSNTIAMGEILPSCGDHHRGGWYHPNAQWTATTPQINFNTCGKRGVNDRGRDCNDYRIWMTSQGYKSDHTGGANFVFSDGSVTFLTENIDYISYQQMGSKNDEETISKDSRN